MLALAVSLWLAPLQLAWAADTAVKANAEASRDSATVTTQADSTTSSAVVRNRQTAASIRALIDGTLDVSVLPESLFDVPLDDEVQLQVAAQRTRALLASADGSESAKGSKGTASDKRALWDSQLELDRARLAFYELPIEQRQALLAAQAEKVAASSEEQQQMLEAERQAREAEEERQRALEAAQRARSEAERLVAGETARLLGLEKQLAGLEGEFNAERRQLAANAELLIGWQQRVNEALAGTPADADQTYDALRKTLRTTRDELGAALDALAQESSRVPEIGDDPLVSVPADIDTTAVHAKREELLTMAARLRFQEHQLRVDQGAQLIDLMGELNRDRLRLLDLLSADKRGAITGLTAAAVDQASSELRHFLLIVRYHRYVIGNWLAAVRHPGASLESSAGNALGVLLPWIVIIIVFVWIRRLIPKAIRALAIHLEQENKRLRLPQPTPALKAVRFASAVHRPLLWALLFLMLWWFLPAEARQLFEVQIVSVIIAWSIAGALIVSVINAAFTMTAKVGNEAVASGELRLRSLRLVSRLVVVFGLILVLSAKLVGEGTIYHWVVTLCWLAALPVFLLLVRWWSATAFERIERIRKKSRFHQWLLANQQGWKSFFAAMSAAVYLFVTGAVHLTKGWLNGFDLARRAHAYLFRRELDKLGKEGSKIALQPLSPAVLEQFVSDMSCHVEFPEEVDAWFPRLLTRIRENEGGVIAIVGERGAGKSWRVARIANAFDAAIRVSCIDGDMGKLRQQLLQAVGLPRNRGLSGFAEAVDAGEQPCPVLLDDVESFIKPLMGGLAEFDTLMAVARQHSRHTPWVLCIDDVVWKFLERGRDIRTMFDTVVMLEAWTEEEIGSLLDARTALVGLEPSFETLLEELPANADEIDRQEALAAKKAAYYRLVWDYARGNPMVALYTWWESLALDDAGKAFVKPFQVPNTSELEKLSDHALFVFRAIMQLHPAAVEEMIKATQLGANQVSDVLRFGKSHGYLQEENDLYTVTWRWYRAMARQLQRRHLLV